MSRSSLYVAVLPASGQLTDAKEVVGGHMLVSAESFDRALEVARERPGLMTLGSSIEIREIAGR